MKSFLMGNNDDPRLRQKLNFLRDDNIRQYAVIDSYIDQSGLCKTFS